MMKIIDDFLNTTTMYRLVLYYLIYLVLAAALMGALGFLPYSPFAILLSATVLVVISWASNYVFSFAFNAPTNVESVYITALILTLVLTPVSTQSLLISMGWTAVVATASKYLLAFNKKHIFNPVAIALFVAALFFRHSASWWIGTGTMLPFVVLPGWLIVRKLRRAPLINTFLASFFITLTAITLLTHPARTGLVWQRGIIDSPVFFFAFVMLTEPLTMPPTRIWQIIYGSLVGILFVPQLSVIGLTLTPEEALLIGNILAYTVSPKRKLMLTLRKIIRLGGDMYDFVFESDAKFRFKAGQYLEWTLPHEHPDSRGNRRFFTIASAPGEAMVRMGVKFYPQASSYKKALAKMKTGDVIAAGQLAGDFVLREGETKKLVFVAGGIGITPFASILADLTERNESRDIILLYANSRADEIVYGDVFTRAQNELGLRCLFTLSDPEHIPAGWQGEKGHITADMILKNIPDFGERTFYISGSHGMVTAVEKELVRLKVNPKQIVTDYFPGFV